MINNIKFKYSNYTISTTRRRLLQKHGVEFLICWLECIEFIIGNTKIQLGFTTWDHKPKEKSFPLFGVGKNRSELGFLQSILSYFPSSSQGKIYEKTGNLLIPCYICISSLRLFSPSPIEFLKHISERNFKGTNLCPMGKFEKDISLKDEEINYLLDRLLSTYEGFILGKFYMYDSFNLTFNQITDKESIKSIIQEIKFRKLELTFYEARYTF